MSYTVTTFTMTRKTVYGRVKRWPVTVVHALNRPQWEGAHYKDANRAMGLLKFIQAKA